ncbi:unnamed protein product [Closterium sp. NIES-53]
MVVNGVAESRVQEITKTARCLLVHASCPPSLWGYALLHAALLTNLYPHPLLPSTTPTELWTKDKLDVSSLRVWGSKAYVLIHPSDRSRSMGKLAPRTLPFIFLGHNPTSHDYLFLHPPSGRLVRSRDVVFDESTPYYSSPPSTSPLPPLTHPLVWSDTTPPPLLPPPSILPPPPPPSSPSYVAPPSSGDIFDPEPLSSPVSPTHSSPSASPPLLSPPLPPTCPSPPPRTVLTRYPHTRSHDGILGAPPPVTLSSSTLPPLSPLLHHFFRAVLHQPPPTAAPSASSPSPAAASATAPAAAPAAGPAAGQATAPAAGPAAGPTAGPAAAPATAPAAAPAATPVVAPAAAPAAAPTSALAAAPAAAPAAIPAFHTSLSEDSHEEFLDLHLCNPSLLPITFDLSGTPVFTFSSAPSVFIPTTYAEAMACPNAPLWLAAIIKELEAFITNSSFVDVPRPPASTNVVKGKWVFRVKQLPGEPPVYKARYCAKGFMQRYAVDFFDTFSPTAKPATIRAELDLPARLNMEIQSMDPAFTFPSQLTLSGSCVDLCMGSDGPLGSGMLNLPPPLLEQGRGRSMEEGEARKREKQGRGRSKEKIEAWKRERQGRGRSKEEGEARKREKQGRGRRKEEGEARKREKQGRGRSKEEGEARKRDKQGKGSSREEGEARKREKQRRGRSKEEGEARKREKKVRGISKEEGKARRREKHWWWSWWPHSRWLL